MARFTGYAPCPNCRKRGADRRGDNLGTWSDGSSHCFSCGYHRAAPFYQQLLTKINKGEEDDKQKAVLPSDFTREIPPEGWKWLLQYGLSYSYWKPFVGYTPKENRLVITFGNPVRFSQGRALSVDSRKWKFYGDGHNYAETIGHEISGPVVIVEDIISAHKVGQVAPALCIFGTNINDVYMTELRRLNRPVVLWLDADQYSLLPKKIERLKMFLKHPVRYVSTAKDPKLLSLDEIKEQLK